MLVVTPLLLDFGAVRKNTTVTNTFLVENAGACRFDIQASVSSPFQIISGGTYSLELRTVGVVIITYTPSGLPADKETVFVTGAAGARIMVTGSLCTSRPCAVTRRVMSPRVLAESQ